MKRLTHFFGESGIKILGLSLLAGSLVGTSVSVVAGGASRSDRVRQQSQERYLEITEIQGTVTYETGSLKAEGRPAKVGDRLRVSGEGISTGSNSRAKLTADNAIGTVALAENTNLQVKNLSTLPNGAKNTQLAMNRGQNRVRVRSFTNPQSRFSIQTPTGIAGVRGTDFTVIVRPNGETRVLTVQGMVEVAAQNQTQRLSAGSYSVIAPGKSPTPPGSISGNLRVSLQVLPAPDEGKVRVSGTVNPINSVLLNNQALEPSPTGQFDTVATLGPDRRLILVVRSPLGEEQVYELAVP